MAFNSITSPLTLANAQSTYQGFKAPSVYTPKPASPGITPGNTPLPGSVVSAPAPAPAYNAAAAAASAAAAKAAAQARSDYDSAKNNAYGSINDVIGDTGNKLNSSVLDYIDSLRSGQRGIDRAAQQNEMSRESGRLGVLDLVGTGIRSGGVMLNNKGATNSSAGEALGKAYSEIGRKELSKVGNQYELGNQDIANQQQDLTDQTTQFQRHFGEQKQSAVNTIVQDASSKLAALNAAAQNASLADRINIEAEKARIRNDALSKLSTYDNVLSNGVSSVTAATTDQNRAAAKSALLAGTAPENAFNYTTNIPAQFQNTGPFASPLQVFSAPKRNDDSQLVGV